MMKHLCRSSTTPREFLSRAEINRIICDFGRTRRCRRRSIAHIAAGKPIGGSSAGLAVLGEFSFASIIDTIHSPEALADPYGNKITISREFLTIPLLKGIITDTHFAKRDRMGRLLVFMARILQDDWAKQVRAIAVEENVAFLLEPDGNGKVVGEGRPIFWRRSIRAEVCRHNEPLKFDGVSVRRLGDKGTFNVKTLERKRRRYVFALDAGLASYAERFESRNLLIRFRSICEAGARSEAERKAGQNLHAALPFAEHVRAEIIDARLSRKSHC